MKKLSFFLLFFTCTLLASANSVTVLIVNKSKHSIYGNSSQVKNGSFFVHDNGVVSPAEIRPGSTAKFETGQALVLCGTEGYVTYVVNFEGKKYYLVVRFDVPYWGDNDFSYDADPPFTLKHVVGGPGSNVTITFEVYGELTAAKVPPPPIAVPSSGNAWVSGTISWKVDMGAPKESLANAFDFEVMAPTKFWPRSANNIADNSDGVYTDYKPLNKANILVEKKEAARSNMALNIYNEKTVINYTVSNLPTGVPIQLRMKPSNGFWQMAGNTPPQPANYPNSKWFVYAEEIKNENGIINYAIKGSWMNNDGTVINTGGNAQGTKLQDLRKVAIKKQIILKPDDFTKNRSLNNRPVMNSRVQPSKTVNVKKQDIKQ